MEYFFITSTLTKFQLKVIPHNAVILNFNNLDSSQTINNLIEFIKKTSIQNILCENDSIHNFFKKELPNHNLINIQNINPKITTHNYIDKSFQNNLKYFILSSFITTLFCYFTINFTQLLIITVTNLFIWILIYLYFIDDEPWTKFREIITQSL